MFGHENFKQMCSVCYKKDQNTDAQHNNDELSLKSSQQDQEDLDGPKDNSSEEIEDPDEKDELQDQSVCSQN